MGSDSVFYNKDSLCFKLPKNMRPTESTEYDYLYTTLVTSFGAVKIDSDRLEADGLNPDITLSEYTEEFFRRNGINKESSKCTYDSDRNSYRFSYSSSPDDSSYYYHSSMLISDGEVIWYIDCICEYDIAPSNINVFETLLNSVYIEKR